MANTPIHIPFLKADHTHTPMQAHCYTPSPSSSRSSPMITGVTSTLNLSKPPSQESALAAGHTDTMSTLVGAASPRCLSSSHDLKTETTEKALKEAYERLGLPINAAVNDETIIDLYQARAAHDPFQKEVLLESIRTISQHKDQSDVLQSFLKSSSISAYESALITLGAGLLTDDSSLILLYKSNAAQGQYHQDRAQKALKLIAGHRGSEKLESFVSTGFNDELQQSNDHSNESTKTSADEKYDIILNEIRHLQAVCEAAKKSSPSHPTLPRAIGGTPSKATNLTTQAHLLSSSWVLWTSQHLHTATLIRVIAGDEAYGYFEYYVNQRLLEKLLHHPDSSDLRYAITPSEPTIIEEVNPYYFSSLLDLLHVEGRYPQYVALQETPFNQDFLSNLYVLAIKFRLTSIINELKHVFGKAACLGQFLSAAEQVYRMGGADEGFRSFFKDQVKLWLDCPESAWADQCCYDDESVCGRSYTEEFFKSAVNIPDLGRDILGIFVDREVARSITYATPEEDVGKARTQGVEAEVWGEDGTGVGNQDGAGSDTDSYHREREAQPEVNEGRPTSNDDVSNARHAEDNMKSMDDLADGKTLFIGNLPSGWEAFDQLRRHFSWYGTVVGVTRDLLDHGAARIKFATKEGANAVLNSDSKFYVDGCHLYIDNAYEGDLAVYLSTLWVSTRPPTSPGPPTGPPPPMSTPSDTAAGEGVTAIAVKSSDALWVSDTAGALYFSKGDRITNVTGVAVPPKQSMLFKPGEKYPPFVPVLSGKNSRGCFGTFLASYVEFETKSDTEDEEPSSCILDGRNGGDGCGSYQRRDCRG